MKVFKYPVPQWGEFTLKLPSDSKILTYQEQQGSAYIWALVNEKSKIIERKFIIVGTGHKVDCMENSYGYIGTIQKHNGNLVWHLFEILLRLEFSWKPSTT